MRTSARNRQMLDRRLTSWKSVDTAVPPRGWLRAIREALGMPLAEVARRTDMSLQRIAQIEASEANGSVQLDTLRRAAEALDCTLVYAIVPRDSLEATVDRQARLIALADAQSVRQTMLLEDQLGAEEEQARLIDELADELKRSPAALWRS